MRSSASSSAYRMVMGFANLFMLVVSWIEPRQRDDESGARARRTIGRERAAVPVDNLAADCEADTGPFIFVAPMQALKDLKDPIAIFFVETDTVIFYDDLPTGRASGERVRLALNLDDGANVGLAELDSIANQILKKLRHLAAVSENNRQLADRDIRACILNAHFEIGNHSADYIAQIHRG